MSEYAETMFAHANVETDLARIKPRGDCVLIRVLPEAEVTASGIVLPQTGKDSSELRVGEVVAVGPGDRLYVWGCDTCTKVFDHFVGEMVFKNLNSLVEELEGMVRLSTKRAPKSPCSSCGENNWRLDHWTRHEMHVKPGDRIWYRRVLANQQLINGELYQLIREEAHIWAVLEN